MLLIMFADKMFIPLWSSDLFNFGRTTRVPSLHPNWVPCGLKNSGLVIFNYLSSLVEYTFTFFLWDMKLALRPNGPIWPCWKTGAVRRHFGSVPSYRKYLNAWLGKKNMYVELYFLYIHCLFQIPKVHLCESIVFIFLYLNCWFLVLSELCLDWVNIGYTSPLMCNFNFHVLFMQRNILLYVVFVICHFSCFIFSISLSH
jgi:hypothetical protein